MSKITITIRQAIELSGIGKTSIYKLIATGKLTPRKLGHRTLLMFDELESCLRTLPLSEAGKRKRLGSRERPAENAGRTSASI